jgi:hypothetical protein
LALKKCSIPSHWVLAAGPLFRQGIKISHPLMKALAQQHLGGPVSPQNLIQKHVQ